MDHALMIEAVSPGVRRVLAPNPGIMTGPGTNTYLIGDAELAVIDPGPDEPAHLDAVAEHGEGRIRWILVTHTHPDHAPGAAGLKERTGAEIWGFDARDDFVPDRLTGDADRLVTSEFSLRAVHTPGHASNHLCYLLEADRILFSGDHVMQGSTVVIRPPDGDMAAYLGSLRRVRDLAPKAIAPGHGRLIEEPEAAIDYYLRHRAEREVAILEALETGATTVDEIVATVYTDVSEELQAVARYSVHAHLLKLVDERLVVGTDIDDTWSTVRY